MGRGSGAGRPSEGPTMGTTGNDERTNGRVLLIDDSRLIRRLVGDLLREADFEVDEADGGPAALRCLERGGYDVVLTDLHMAAPDGFEILRIVKERRLCEVVILTGSHATDVGAAIRALRLGAHDYLTKPLSDPAQALHAVKRAIETKRQADALRAAEARYETLFDNAPIGLYRITVEGRIQDANPAMAQMLGLANRDALRAVSVRRLYFEERDWREWVGCLESCEVASHREVRLRHLDGSIVWVEESARPVRNAEGRMTAYEGSLRNVTERHLAELRVREAQLQQKAILDNIPDIAWLKDDQGRFIAVNKALAIAIGRPAEELSGLTDADIWPHDLAQRYRAHDSRVMQMAQGARVEEPFAGKEGDVRWIETIRTPVIGKDGDVVGTAGVARDITERRLVEEELHRTERRLRQVQKLEAVGRLAGGVAHDFNNVLNVIVGYSEMLLRRVGPDEQRRVREILKAAERATALTRQLLAFGRRQVIQPKVLSLDALVTDVAEMLAQVIGEDVELRMIASSGSCVNADPGQLEQVLLNLAINGRDAMPRGGTLTLETANVTVGERDIDGAVRMPPGDYVLLRVSDTGAGMSADTKSRIFEPFFSTKPREKGSGLGLATVYGIVKQSGGHIWVDSAIGRGTSFSIYLARVADLPDLVEAAPVSTTTTSRGGETVLIVEDEELARDMLRETMEMFGYTAWVAANADEALGILRGAQEPIDALVTDVVMPGMSGFELAKQVKREYPGIRILYLSGYAAETIANHGAPEESAAFLAKPFSPSELVRKLREVLGEAGCDSRTAAHRRESR
jgi:PAS domain S-box-containing protein